MERDDAEMTAQPLQVSLETLDGDRLADTPPVDRPEAPDYAVVEEYHSPLLPCAAPSSNAMYAPVIRSRKRATLY